MSANFCIGARPLGVGDHLDNLGEHGIVVDALRLHDQAAGAIDGGASHWVPCDLFSPGRVRR